MAGADSPQPSPLRGILLMVIAVGTFVLMDTVAKYLSRWYPVPLIVWARYAANLAILLAFLAGLAGALVIVRPGSELFTPYALLPLGMAVCNALY